MPTGWIDPSSAIALTSQIGSQPNCVTMGSIVSIADETAEHADDDGAEAVAAASLDTRRASEANFDQNERIRGLFPVRFIKSHRHSQNSATSARSLEQLHVLSTTARKARPKKNPQEWNNLSQLELNRANLARVRNSIDKTGGRNVQEG
jgi:hypothetical protein